MPMLLKEPLLCHISPSTGLTIYNRKIIDKNLRDSYKFDPVVVDLIDDIESSPDIEISGEYQRYTGLINQRVAGASDIKAGWGSVFVHNPRVFINLEYWRPLHEGDVPDYIVTCGKGDVFYRSVKVMCPEDLPKSKAVRNFIIQNSAGGLALYKYDFKTRRYHKKFSNGMIYEEDGVGYYLLNRVELLLSEL